MLIALGVGLSLIAEWIPFLNLPFGGTVTPASLLPLVLISYLYGVRWGLGAGFVYALFQMAIGFRTVSGLFLPDSDAYMGSLWIALAILLIDYLFAFTAVGLCYLFHVLSGAIFYGAWAEWFFTESAAKDLALSAWVMRTFSGAGLATVYSLVYNGLYMLPETVITALAAVAVSRLSMVKKAL